MRNIERWFGPSTLGAFALVLVLGAFNSLQHGVPVHGAGATFPAPLYTRWMALFERAHPHIDLHYAAVGSGAGIAAITERTAVFGASDALLNEREREDLPAELLEIPMVLGPVVVAYNLPDLNDRLTLDAETVAGIYLGQITRWDDPAIAALNPGVDLPSTAVHVAHRADSSGTTSIFTDYLTAVSPTWAAEVGRGKVVDWPVSAGAGEGNDGVAQQILLRNGGVGYLELTYAQNAGLDYAALVNRDGQAVLPSVESVQAAERNTPATPGAINKPSIVNAPGPDSYPIAGFTYLLVYRDMTYIEEHGVAAALVDYLEWALTDGQAVAPLLGYTPLPEELRQQALEQVQSIETH